MVGGDRLPWPSDDGAPTASPLEAKIFFNSVMFTPGSWFICADTKDYFICSPMQRYEYAKIFLYGFRIKFASNTNYMISWNQTVMFTVKFANVCMS